MIVRIMQGAHYLVLLQTLIYEEPYPGDKGTGFKWWFNSCGGRMYRPVWWKRREEFDFNHWASVPKAWQVHPQDFPYREPFLGFGVEPVRHYTEFEEIRLY